MRSMRIPPRVSRCPVRIPYLLREQEAGGSNPLAPTRGTRDRRSARGRGVLFYFFAPLPSDLLYMPRQRRAWEPGDLLSIVGRAHEGRPIFATDEDRAYFTDRLKRVFVRGEADLLAWALMVNHYHLVIRVRDAEPGRLFLRLNTVIARRERRRRGDHGAVFQDRYWSGRCEGEGSALALLTYVLGNPVHHGVVETAEAL